MGSINRADITIAVTPDGQTWIAQGNPARATLPADCITEAGLYYSQIRHRCAYQTWDGAWHLGTWQEAARADVRVKRSFDLQQRCTGRARRIF